jgi:hypothetical protein
MKIHFSSRAWLGEQQFGGGMQLSSLFDRQREGLRYRQPIVILDRRILLGIEHPRRRRHEAPVVLGEREFESLAIGGRLLMGERQAAQRLRQILGRRTVATAAGARDQVVGADLLWP